MPDVVSTFAFRRGAQSSCTCGWDGRRRLGVRRAEVDALLHSAAAGCLTNYPLSWRGGMPAHRERPVAAVSMLMAFGVFLGSVLWASSAHADDDLANLSHVQFAYVKTFGSPVICDVIGLYPTVSGVQGVTLSVMEDGFTRGEAESIISASVQLFCGSRFDLVKRAEGTTLPVVKA